MAIKLGIRTNNTPNGQKEKITLNNLKQIWRQGTSYSFDIGAPQGYSIYWYIYESQTRNLVKQGVGSIANHTFTQNAENMTHYDIVVRIRKGTLLFERWGRRDITCLPALFTEAQASVVWDLSTTGITYRDNNLVDRTAYRVYIKGVGSTAGYLGLEEWVSTDLHRPVHFLFAPTAGVPATINSSGAYCLRVNQNCKNILIDGMADPTVPYGLKLAMPGTGNRAQPFYIEASTNAGSNASTAGSSIWVCGVEIQGNNISSAGIKVDTANTNTVGYDAYLNTGAGGALFGLNVFNCKVQGTVDEGIYFGYVSDLRLGGPPAYAHAPLVGTIIFNLQTINTGGDGMQMGASMFDAEVHNNTVINAGTRNDNSHKNAMQLSSGCRNTKLFRNRVDTAQNLFSFFTGRGGTNVEVFANLFVSAATTGNVNNFIVLYQNEYLPSISYKFYSNTYRLANEVPFEVWDLDNTVTTTFSPFVSANNLLVCNTLTQYKVMNAPVQTGWTINNYQVTNIATPGFVNAGAGDYHIANTSSPAFRAQVAVTKGHFLSNHDFEGIKFLEDHPIVGCYSAYELFT